VKILVTSTAVFWRHLLSNIELGLFGFGDLWLRRQDYVASDDRTPLCLHRNILANLFTHILSWWWQSVEMYRLIWSPEKTSHHIVIVMTLLVNVADLLRIESTDFSSKILAPWIRSYLERQPKRSLYRGGEKPLCFIKVEMHTPDRNV
jgi:hypothetical protein